MSDRAVDAALEAIRKSAQDRPAKEGTGQRLRRYAEAAVAATRPVILEEERERLEADRWDRQARELER